MATEIVTPEKAEAGGRKFARQILDRYGYQIQYSIDQEPRSTDNGSGTPVKDPNLWKIVNLASARDPLGSQDSLNQAMKLLEDFVHSTREIELIAIGYLGIPWRLTGIKSIEAAGRKVVKWPDIYKIFLREVIREITPHFPNGTSDSSVHFG